MESSARTKDLHQIGEVAERAGLSLRTVRYYEEAGLVSPCERTEGGFRLYGEEEIARLEVIKQMKPLGFTVQEMRELLLARDELAAATPGARVHQQALELLADYAERAKAKTYELRRQLETAERFASGLQREMRRERKRTGDRAP